MTTIRQTVGWKHRSARAFAVVVAAAAIAGCGESQEETDRRQMVEEQIRHKETAGPPLSDQVVDSLRVMSRRYNVTREEYWDGKGGVLANDHFEVWYPPGKVTVTHGMYTLAGLAEARKRSVRYFGRAPDRLLKAVCAMSMNSFNQQTGREWWAYYRLDDDEIYFQPVEVLYNRNLLDIAVARGYYEWSIGRLSGGSAPHWLRHGMASVLSDEGLLLEEQLEEFPGENVKMTLAEIEGALSRVEYRKYYRIAAYNAFRLARRLAVGPDRARMAEAMRRMGEGESLEAAFEAAYGKPYDDLIAAALDFKVNR